jgi:hypothetical protein
MGNINVQFNKNADEEEREEEIRNGKQFNQQNFQSNLLTTDQKNIINATNTLFRQQSKSLIHLETNLFNQPPIRTSYALNVQLPNSPEVLIPPIQFNYPFI